MDIFLIFIQLVVFDIYSIGICIHDTDVKQKQ